MNFLHKTTTKTLILIRGKENKAICEIFFELKKQKHLKTY